MSASRYVTVAFDEILKETDKAFLVRLPDEEEVWIPYSQIADYEDYNAGDEDGELSVTEWIAKEKGLL